MKRGTLRLRVGRERLLAEARHHGPDTWAGEATYASLAELSDAIARLAAETPQPCRRLVVRLERPPVQLRTLTDVPPVKPRDLVALVVQQAERFFRRNGKELVTDAQWIGTGPGRVARAAAVEESLVDAIAAGARAAGLTLEAITPADELALLMLLPRSDRAARERAARQQVRRLTIVAAGIWVGVAALFLGRLVWERRAVERELAALAQPLAALVAGRRELRDAEAALRAVTLAERERGRSLGLLAALTAALPDSAVLTSLTWNADGSGVLIGAARRAADVVARLERAEALPGVRFEGPTVRESVGGRAWERFTALFGASRGEGKEGGG